VRARDRIAEDGSDDVKDAAALLLSRAQDAHEDGQGACSPFRAISGAGLAVHDGGSKRLLRRPVGGFKLSALQEQEEFVSVTAQVLRRCQ
jgi:hypothetical protein